MVTKTGRMDKLERRPAVNMNRTPGLLSSLDLVIQNASAELAHDFSGS